MMCLTQFGQALSCGIPQSSWGTQKHGFSLTSSPTIGNSTTDITETMNILSGHPWPFWPSQERVRALRHSLSNQMLQVSETFRGRLLGGLVGCRLGSLSKILCIVTGSVRKRDNFQQCSLPAKSACFYIYLAEVESWGTIKYAWCLPITGARS